MMMRLATAGGMLALLTTMGLAQAPPPAKSAGAASGKTGSIQGHVRLMAQAPANPIIRMGADPICAALNRKLGTRPVQEIVVRSAGGGLANVFVDLDGSFPQTAVPATPVTIDQRGCVYVPRVLGARVGQTLLVKNDDGTVHNVHSISTQGNDFNASQPKAGMETTITLKKRDVMLRLKCDIHSWMVSYIGVETHPYFSVSAVDGTFRLDGVPPGQYMIRAWHERYGLLSQRVTVRAGGAATVDFSYTGTEKPPAVAIQELRIPGLDGPEHVHPRSE